MHQSHALGFPWQKWRVMSTVAEGHATDRFEFYASQYTRFGSEVTSSIRREVYGEDVGQQGWRTLDEQAVIANLILESSPCHVLDIACGSGGPSLSLVKQTGCRLTGVDAEVAGIDRAGQQAMAQGLSHRARFEIADCSERLPYPDETFDVVICIDAVLHLKNRFSALADWCRLLRPQGRVIFTDAAIVTGSISIEELNIRASQGSFLLVPPGLNEEAVRASGLVLRLSEDRTRATAEIAARWHVARERRAVDLQKVEGEEMVHSSAAFSRNDGGVGGERPPFSISLRRRSDPSLNT
jgi:2-polyprenyl-3-methyl-5-hydroxy-6-metoxy-1,4-benzoquinol methylase